MHNVPRARKLQWLCRRGMKELDVLLLRFLAADHPSISLDDQESGPWAGLEELLGQEDDVLWDWLQNPSTCPDRSQRPLLRRIRNG